MPTFAYWCHVGHVATRLITSNLAPMEAHQQPDSGRPYRSNLAGVWQSTLPDNPRLAAASLYHTLGPRRKSSISQESWATDTFMNSEEGNSLDMVHWAELNPPRSAPATTASQYQVIVPPIASERLGTRVEFTQRFHKTSPNAPKRAARSLLPELHRMPPPQTASRSNLSTPTISTAEEIRLLGSYGYVFREEPDNFTKLLMTILDAMMRRQSPLVARSHGLLRN